MIMWLRLTCQKSGKPFLIRRRDVIHFIESDSEGGCYVLASDARSSRFVKESSEEIAAMLGMPPKPKSAEETIVIYRKALMYISNGKFKPDHVMIKEAEDALKKAANLLPETPEMKE